MPARILTSPPLPNAHVGLPTIAWESAAPPTPASQRRLRRESAATRQTTATAACPQTDASPPIWVVAFPLGELRPGHKVRVLWSKFQNRSAISFRRSHRKHEPVPGPLLRRRMTWFRASDGPRELLPAVCLRALCLASSCRQRRRPSPS